MSSRNRPGCSTNATERIFVLGVSAKTKRVSNSLLSEDAGAKGCGVDDVTAVADDDDDDDDEDNDDADDNEEGLPLANARR